MPKNLSDIRWIVERDTGTLDNESLVNWCNDCNVEIGSSINVPAPTFQIEVNTTDLEYALPTDLKEINKLWLQSDYDGGINRELTRPFRIYSGKIQFPTSFPASDILNVDYYKYLTFFTDIDDEIDLEDQFVTVYTSYCVMRYYSLPDVQDRLGELAARRNFERSERLFFQAKNQVISYYGFQNPDVSVRERW